MQRGKGRGKGEGGRGKGEGRRAKQTRGNNGEREAIMVLIRVVACRRINSQMLKVLTLTS